MAMPSHLTAEDFAHLEDQARSDAEYLALIRCSGRSASWEDDEVADERIEGVSKEPRADEITRRP